MGDSHHHLDSPAAKMSEQIDYMRQFILHEAREQASEIDAKADQEFYAEKVRLVKTGSLKIQAEHDRRMNEVSVSQQIAQSNIHNNYILKSFASTFTSEFLGGVILSNSHDNVIVDQTFNARLTVCFERAVPVLKPMLFGGGGSKHFD